jgi:hypothetical protein
MTVDTSERSLHRGSAALAAGAGLALVLAVALLGGALVGSATAGDQPTVIYAAEENYTVAAGDSLTVDVYVASDGGVGDVGVEAMTIVTAYNASILTVEDVEPAPWLEGDEPTDVETNVEVNNGAGEVVVEQRRDPPADGTTGDERIATLTFEAAADAPAGTTTLAFDDSDVRLTDEYSVPIFGNDATIAVEEGSDGSAVPATTAGIGLVAVTALLALGAVAVRRR